jgi:predicted acylesterase/phospholipase RssA
MNYKTLVLSGGGSKGVTHLGALEFCWQMSFLKNIKRYWGVSVGSIISLFLILEYTPQDIFEMLYRYGLFQISDIDTDTIKLSALMPIESLGDRIMDFVARTSNFFDASTTFKQLHKKTGKHLNIIGTRVEGSSDGSNLEHFNHKLTPDMPVIDAIEISCALPFIFTEKIYKGIKYIDGCFVNEFPIDMIGSKDKTLAIWVRSDGKTEYGILNNIYKILTVSMNHMQYMRNKNAKKYDLDIIEIMSTGTGFSELNLSRSKQVELWGIGFRGAEEFYSKKFMDGWEFNIDL